MALILWCKAVKHRGTTIKSHATIVSTHDEHFCRVDEFHILLICL